MGIWNTIQTFFDQYRFLPFMVGIIGIILLPGLLYNVGPSSVLVFNISYTIVVLLGVAISWGDRLAFRRGLVLGGLTIVTFWVGAIETKLWELAWPQIVMGLIFFAFIGVQLIKAFFKAPTVDLNLIFGAIAGYMVIGIIGGELCALLDYHVPEAFTITTKDLSAYKYFYFSFVTLSTLGYGDIVPNNDAGGALTVLLSLAGQIYLTIIMAIIIGKFVAEKR